mmetsp:Transcript_50059/g.163034  ORF Transcript_50059/g.163034 Transcript_50059/m.163034 type:complete len:135 (+) Transcript_50059:247-651(+)
MAGTHTLTPPPPSSPRGRKTPLAKQTRLPSPRRPPRREPPAARSKPRRRSPAALKKLVHEAHGEHCVPTDLIPIGAIPRTHNSKPMRQVVGQLFAGNFGGDVAEISNPECLTELGATIADWRAMRASPVLDELP